MRRQDQPSVGQSAGGARNWRLLCRHLAALAVERVVELPARALEVGHHISVGQDGALGAVLEAHRGARHPAALGPRPGAVAQLGGRCSPPSAKRRAAVSIHGAARSSSRAFGQADDVTDLATLAPGQHLVAAEARIRAQDDATWGQACRSRVTSSFNIAQACLAPRCSKAADSSPAADRRSIERQEAVAIVVAVKEPSLLFAMHRDRRWRRSRAVHPAPHQRRRSKSRPSPRGRPTQARSAARSRRPTVDGLASRRSRPTAACSTRSSRKP